MITIIVLITVITVIAPITVITLIAFITVITLIYASSSLLSSPLPSLRRFVLPPA